jgi:arginyl-tRNA--protein-N-Asp/Glu arginylyltransferase
MSRRRQPSFDGLSMIPLPPRPHPCGYFGDKQADFEHYWAFEMSDDMLSALIDNGYRHFGGYFFRPGPNCCGLCLPTRLPVAQFAPSKSQRRTWREGQKAGIELLINRPRYEPEKFALYRRHKERFDTSIPENEEDFQRTFYSKVPGLWEFEYRLEGQLVGVGFVTMARGLASSMYFFYGDAGAELSLGTYSALAEIDYCQKYDIPYLHLGYYIAGNRWMRYKGSFRPSEVFLQGEWRPFRRADGSWAIDPETTLCRFGAPPWRKDLSGGGGAILGPGLISS